MKTKAKTTPTKSNLFTMKVRIEHHDRTDVVDLLIVAPDMIKAVRATKRAALQWLLDDGRTDVKRADVELMKVEHEGSIDRWVS